MKDIRAKDVQRFFERVATDWDGAVRVFLRSFRAHSTLE